MGSYILFAREKRPNKNHHALGFPDDIREYQLAADMLRALDVKSVRLMTNNPRKIVGLEGYGLDVTDRVPVEVEPDPENLKYLQCKKDKMGHMLDLIDNKPGTADK